MGGFLLDLRGTLERIVEAISFHLYPSSIPEKEYDFVESDDFTLTSVHVTNYICDG